MIVGMDGEPLLGRRAGVGRYTMSVLAELARTSTDRFQILIPGLRPSVPRAVANELAARCPNGNVSLVAPKLLSPTVLKPMWRVLGWPAVERWLPKIELFHGTNHYLPTLRTAAGVLTIYDVSFRQLPEHFTWSMRSGLDAHMKSSLRYCRRVIAISEYTKQEFIRYYDFPAARIDVTPLAPAPIFRRIDDRARLDAVRAEHALPAQYVLSVATLQPRKNLVGLIRAFHRALPKLPDNCQLVLVGAKGWLAQPIFKLIAELGIEDRIRWLGYVSDEQLVAVYQLATCFAYVSLYEGFGLPILEAMACGVPVISGDNTSLPEVAGDAAILVDAMSEDAIASGLERMLGDPKLREDLGARGLARAALFGWDRTARETRATYELALGS